MVTKKREGKKIKRPTLSSFVLEIEMVVDHRQKHILDDTLNTYRMVRNTTLGFLEKRYKDLTRTKRYKRLREEYGELLHSLSSEKNADVLNKLRKQKEDVSEELSFLRKQHQLTKHDAEQYAKRARKHFNNKIDAVLTQTAANSGLGIHGTFTFW
jgi:hypothetical protein